LDADHPENGVLIPCVFTDRHVPHCGVQRQPDKPPEQQIVVELLHQLPAPSAPNRTPATAAREAISPAGSMAVPAWRTASRIPTSVHPAPGPQSSGSAARDDRMALALRSSNSGTTQACFSTASESRPSAGATVRLLSAINGHSVRLHESADVRVTAIPSPCRYRATSTSSRIPTGQGKDHEKSSPTDAS
jgi:hypothetical protein